MSGSGESEISSESVGGAAGATTAGVQGVSGEAREAASVRSTPVGKDTQAMSKAPGFVHAQSSKDHHPGAKRGHEMSSCQAQPALTKWAAPHLPASSLIHTQMFKFNFWGGCSPLACFSKRCQISSSLTFMPSSVALYCFPFSAESVQFPFWGLRQGGLGRGHIKRSREGTVNRTPRVQVEMGEAMAVNNCATESCPLRFR